MKKYTKPTALSPNLEKVRDRFAIWRSRKKPGSRIPKALWQAAIESCKSDSVLHVSKALHLNYNELKERFRETQDRMIAFQNSITSDGRWKRITKR